MQNVHNYASGQSDQSCCKVSSRHNASCYADAVEAEGGLNLGQGDGETLNNPAERGVPSCKAGNDYVVISGSTLLHYTSSFLVTSNGISCILAHFHKDMVDF